MAAPVLSWEVAGLINGTSAIVSGASRPRAGIVDLTDGCGCAMHGRKSGERLIYRCGRYVNSGGHECHHNTVDGDAMLRRVLDALVECVGKAGTKLSPRPLTRCGSSGTRQADGSRS